MPLTSTKLKSLPGKWQKRIKQSYSNNSSMNEYMNKWTNERMDGRTNGCTNERTNDWMNERTNQRMNEWMEIPTQKNQKTKRTSKHKTQQNNSPCITPEYVIGCILVKLCFSVSTTNSGWKIKSSSISTGVNVLKNERQFIIRFNVWMLAFSTGIHEQQAARVG